MLVSEKPKQITMLFPLEQGNHTELDASELLNDNIIHQHQLLIGSSQRVLSLGSFDVACVIVSLTSG